MIKENISASIVILFLLLSIAFIGCSPNFADNPEDSSLSPSIKVLPYSYEFGIVTEGNSTAPLEIEITNDGSAKLKVSDIALSDTNNFALDLNGGSNPCNTASLTISAGGKCTAEVDFQPTSNASFDVNLTIKSNCPDNSTLNVPLSGSHEPLSELNAQISQVETCPGPAVTAFVSVADQAGYPVTTLTKNDFSVIENGIQIVDAPTSVSFVYNTATISVALVMDYSGSITKIKDAVDDMEESVASFVNEMGADDEAEIVKFGNIVEVVQDFASDKDDLKAAIYALWDNDSSTSFYDAVWQAVDDTAARLKDRRAVIVITDGEDTMSSKGFEDVINHATDNGVPIFTVALGQADISILQQMADDTGGQVYQATNSDNLRNIYQQLADVLFHDQYILTYTSGLGAGVTADLTIEATLLAIEGNDTREITSCP